jgi:uncharacterized damage-inducible protein DinB
MTELDEQGRPEPPLAGDETATLLGFLDFHRGTLEWKCAGLDDAALRTTVAASSVTLGGMLRHLARVESFWVNDILLGGAPEEPWGSVDWDADPDWDWESARGEPAARMRAAYDEAVRTADARIARVLADGGLDHLSVVESSRPGGGRFNLRHVLMRLIEEYARHNGHADLIRESLDGSTGV